MKTLFIAVLSLVGLAMPAAAAVSKDGGQPSVNPCLNKPISCEAAATVDAGHEVTEPMVIFLDDEGNTVARMPLSRFRKEVPEAKLPPQLEGEKK